MTGAAGHEFFPAYQVGHVLADSTLTQAGRDVLMDLRSHLVALNLVMFAIPAPL